MATSENTSDTRIDQAVEDRVRRLESQGVDAKDIHVDSPLRGTVEETRATGTSQLGRPLGRAAGGLVAGILLGALAGGAIGAAVDLFVPVLLLGAIAGALLGALNALYSRLPMSSKAFDADGARAARVSVHEQNRSDSDR